MPDVVPAVKRSSVEDTIPDGFTRNSIDNLNYLDEAPVNQSADLIHTPQGGQAQRGANLVAKRVSELDYMVVTTSTSAKTTYLEVVPM